MTAVLDVEELDFEGVFLNEVSSFFDVVAHQDAEEPVGFTGVFDLDAEQGPRGGVHSGFPELLGVHFTEAFEAFYFDAFSTDLSYARADVPERGDFIFIFAVDELEFRGQCLA